MTFLVQTPIDWVLHGKGRGWGAGGRGGGRGFLFPPLGAVAFAFTSFRRVGGRSPGLNGHGVTGSVRSSGAAARMGCPGCRKWVSLGPGTLQFLCASSGARASPGNAGEDCRDPGEMQGGGGGRRGLPGSAEVRKPGGTAQESSIQASPKASTWR